MTSPLHSLFASRLTIHLQVTSNGLILHPFHLKNITFSHSSLQETSVAFLRQVPGLYHLQLTLSGPDSSLYRVVYSDSQNLTVISPTEKLPPPSLQTVAFSEDGAHLLVRFNAATNRAGYTNSFPCGTVFAMQPLEDMSLYRCLWVSDKSVRMLLHGNSQVNIGDVLTLRSGVLRAKCSSSSKLCAAWNANAVGSLAITAPPSPGPCSFVTHAWPGGPVRYCAHGCYLLTRISWSTLYECDVYSHHDCCQCIPPD